MLSIGVSNEIFIDPLPRSREMKTNIRLSFSQPHHRVVDT